MKKNKIIFYLILILSIVLIGTGSYLTYKNLNSMNVEQKEENTPLLYEVTKKGSNNKIYLLGSVHVGDIDKIKLPKYLMDAYNSSEYVAFELIDSENIINPNDFLLKEGDNINNHLSKETIDKIKDFLNKQGMSANFNEKFKPGAFSVLIESAIINKTGYKVGVDQYFLKKARNDNKVLIAIEDEKDQIDLLLNQSDKFYEILINNKIKNFEKNVNIYKELYNAWKKGIIKEEIKKANEEENSMLSELTFEERQILENFNMKILMDRDINMTLSFNSYFDQNYKMLYIVGALHVVGEGGIVTQLENQGYTVKVVK